jgi:trehalose 6-phosphate phosphatase
MTLPATVMSDVIPIADRALDRLAHGGHVLLLADYDGTLAPIVPDPAMAQVPDEVRADLKTLARAPHVHVGLVSGRDLRDLRARVAVPEAMYAGCHGLEIEGPGMRFVHPEAEAQEEVLAAIARELRQRAPGVPGMRVEPKRFGLAVHYRHVAPHEVQKVEEEMARAIRRDGTRLKIFHGTKVIEIQPQVSWTKGDCVLWIREAVRRETGDRLMVIYMGDDWTDEHAFQALAGQAITISVGTLVPATRAAHRVADVAAIRQLIAALAARARLGGWS